MRYKFMFMFIVLVLFLVGANTDAEVINLSSYVNQGALVVGDTLAAPGKTDRVTLLGAEFLSCQVLCTALDDTVYVKLEGSNFTDTGDTLWFNLDTDDDSLAITETGSYLFLFDAAPSVKSYRLNFTKEVGGTSAVLRTYWRAGTGGIR